MISTNHLIKTVPTQSYLFSRQKDALSSKNQSPSPSRWWEVPDEPVAAYTSACVHRQDENKRLAQTIQTKQFQHTQTSSIDRNKRPRKDLGSKSISLARRVIWAYQTICQCMQHKEQDNNKGVSTNSPINTDQTWRDLLYRQKQAPSKRNQGPSPSCWWEVASAPAVVCREAWPGHLCGNYQPSADNMEGSLL